jgi:hypothetical protein
MSPTVGADIEAMCNKCGGARWHVIEAKVGEEIVRVQCKECGAQHRYRNPNKAAPAPRRAAATGEQKPRAPRSEKVVERFPTPAVAADLSRPVRPYAASEHYTPGDRVEHPTFGQGVVEVVEPGKVTVFFAVGRKVLVQAKGEPGKGLARPRPFDHSGGVGIPGPGKSSHAHVHVHAHGHAHGHGPAADSDEADDGGN